MMRFSPKQCGIHCMHCGLPPKRIGEHTHAARHGQRHQETTRRPKNHETTRALFPQCWRDSGAFRITANRLSPGAGAIHEAGQDSFHQLLLRLKWLMVIYDGSPGDAAVRTRAYTLHCWSHVLILVIDFNRGQSRFTAPLEMLLVRVVS